MNEIKKWIVGSLLLSSVLSADIAFDLHAQHFSKAIEGKYEGARYDLPYSYASTNLKYEDGYYITQNSSGYFNVEVKEPKEGWSVSFDAYYRFSYRNYVRTVKLVSENGESVVLSLSSKDSKFNSTSVFSAGSNLRVTASFSQVGENIELSINGEQVGVAKKKTFGALKYIEIQLINEDGTNDRLNSLTIGSK